MATGLARGSGFGDYIYIFVLFGRGSRRFCLCVAIWTLLNDKDRTYQTRVAFQHQWCKFPIERDLSIIRIIMPRSPQIAAMVLSGSAQLLKRYVIFDIFPNLEKIPESVPIVPLSFECSSAWYAASTSSLM